MGKIEVCLKFDIDDRLMKLLEYSGVDIKKYIQDTLERILKENLFRREVEEDRRKVSEYDPRKAVEYALMFGVESALDKYFRLSTRNKTSLVRDRSGLKKLIELLKRKSRYELLGEKRVGNYYVLVIKEKGLNDYYVFVMGCNKPYIIYFHGTRDKVIKRAGNLGMLIKEYVRNITEPVLEGRKMDMEKIREEMEAIRDSYK